MSRAPATPTPEPLVCAGCGKRALHNALFHPVTGTGQSRPLTYCPRCWRRRERSEGRLGCLVVPLIAAVVVLVEPRAVFWWVVLNLVLTATFLQLLVVPHELGHALAGWLAGLRLFRIHIGSDISIYLDGRWGIFRRDDFPLGVGATLVGFPHVRWFRLRRFLMVLGGPLVNVLIVAAVVWGATPGDLWEQVLRAGSSVRPVLCLALANVLSLVISLVPSGADPETGSLPSDGRQLAEAPFTPDEQVRQMHAGYLIAEAQECGLANDFDGARAWFEACLEHYPDHTLARSGLYQLLLHDRRFPDARRGWLELAGRPELEPLLHMQFLDCAATADLLLVLDGVRTLSEGDGPVEVLGEARRLSDEAIGQLDVWPPLAASFYGTRGGLLVEEGQLDEGGELLEVVLEEFDDPRLKAICACYLALAAARQGDRVQSAEWLAEARTLDPDCPFLPGTARQCPV